MNKVMAFSAAQREQTDSLTMFQRIAKNDHRAIEDCTDTYGNFVWALAKKFTNSNAEAEVAAQEIFIDIWKYAQRADLAQTPEHLVIALIARRRLIKHLQ